MSTEAQQQIAREAADLWMQGEDALGRKRQDQKALEDIILSAIERVTKELQGANDNLFKVARKHCVENKKLKDEWPEGYDLTSFLHGDDPSAQPRRIGQQEWTLVPQSLHFNIMCGATVIYEGVTSEKQGNALVAAHNTALTDSTERQRQLDWDELAKLENALAAERQHRERAEKSLQATFETLNRTAGQLLSERQRREQAEQLRDAAMLREVQLGRELLSAQAAIGKHNKECGDNASEPSFNYKIYGVDLSLLHQHDAEVRKPLVDALEIQRKALDVWRMSVNSDSLECKVANKAIGAADALAKVKEGNEKSS